MHTKAVTEIALTDPKSFQSQLKSKVHGPLRSKDSLVRRLKMDGHL